MSYFVTFYRDPADRKSTLAGVFGKSRLHTHDFWKITSQTATCFDDGILIIGQLEVE